MIRPYRPIIHFDLRKDFPGKAEQDLISSFQISDIATLSNELTIDLFFLENKFLFLVENSDSPFIEKNLEIILGFVFSKNYFTIQDNPVLLVSESRSPDLLHALQLLETFIKAQGYKKLEVLTTKKLDSYQAPDVNAVVLLRKVVKEDILFIMLTTLRTKTALLFFSGEGHSSLEIEKIFLSQLQISFPKTQMIGSLLQDYFNLKVSAEEKDARLEELSEKLKHAATFVEIAKYKYKSDYEALLKFYNHEYEVLPLWFKRLGHVVKVIGGKRTFSSLLNRRR